MSGSPARLARVVWRVAWAMVIVAPLQCRAGDGASWSVGGYLKNLLTDSHTMVGPPDHYQADLSRLRLQLKGDVAPHVSIDVQYDNEILVGGYLQTPQFQLAKELPSRQYWDLEANHAERAHLYGLQRLYRASAIWSAGETDVRFGRQRIAWGTGRFWSPMDLLNPVAPTALEREERPGVDALLVERKVGPLSRMSVVYAPQHDANQSSAAAMWHDNRAGIDYSLMTGRFGRDVVVGGDLAAQLGQAGIRAELTRTAPPDASSFVRVLLALDYAFANTLTVSAEYFYDGGGTEDRSRYDFTALLNGTVRNLARHYVGAWASYEITPLLKTRHELAVNLDDRSRYYSPALIYSIRTNVDARLGAQFFEGSKGSEFGFFKRVVYGQLQWFF